MITENFTQYFADWGTTATLAGVPLSAVLDSETIIDLETGSTAPSAIVLSSASASAAPGQVFVCAAVNYTVRQVQREPPDGVLTRLILART